MHRTQLGTVLFGSHPQQLEVLEIDTSFANMLRLNPTLGRLISREEILRDVSVAVISDTLWRSYFAGDSTVIGRSFLISGKSYTVVGVLPKGFRFPSRSDLFVPLAKQVQPKESDNRVSVILKLRLGRSREAAEAELSVIASRVASDLRGRSRGNRLVLREEMIDRRANSLLPAPSVFLSASFLVLLVASSNVASLLGARANSRKGEMALRGALGASRHRLLGQIVVENAVLVGIGAALGTILSMWAVRICVSLIPSVGFPSWIEFGVSERVLLFAIGVAALVTLMVGLEPARNAVRYDLVRPLQLGGDAGSVRQGLGKVHRRATIIQLMAAVIVFVGAALLVRSYQQLVGVNLGYPAKSVVSVAAFFDRTRYPSTESQMRFVERVLPRVEGLTNARFVAGRGYYSGSREGPDSKGEVVSNHGLFADGDTVDSNVGGLRPRFFVVTHDYFRALGLQVLGGRTFDQTDTERSERVAVVSRRLADRLWPGREAVGHQLQVTRQGPTYSIVGVVEDVRDVRGGRSGVTASAVPDVYFSANQARAAQIKLLVRTEGDVNAMHGAVATLLRAEDPTLIIYSREKTLADQTEGMLSATRVFGGLIGGFAATALLLAIVGIYGLVAYSVSQRAREVGVRIALGATGELIIRMFMREALLPIAIGLSVGLAGAVVGARALKFFLFGVPALHLPTFAAAILLFGTIALVASYLAARRATRLDPVAALRST